MDKRIHTFLRLFLLTECLFSASAKFKIWDFQTAFQGKAIKSKCQRELVVWSKVTCATVCMREAGCLTITYSPVHRYCRMYARSMHHYKAQLTDAKDRDSILTKTTSGVEARADKTCNGNEECDLKDSVCLDGVCRCRIGLYFSTSQGSCLKACTKFENEMDFYYGKGVKEHNTKRLYWRTLSECCEHCFSVTAFTCVTAEWKGHYKYRRKRGLCLLSEIGYLAVEKKFRETGIEGWTLAQRRCS